MSSLSARLRASASRLTRLALGAALGVGLVAAVVGGPAFAQAQGQAPASEPAIAAASPARAVVPATGPGPALWVVRDADSTLYLFGTVHVLRPTTGWGSARVDAAFDSASEVWFEIANPDDQAAMLAVVQQHGLDPARPLSSLLTADEIARLDAAARVLNASAAQLDPFRPWLAALTLQAAPLLKAGYDAQSGVELILKARAVAAGKPTRGFETIDEQVRILATLPEAVQMSLLRASLEDFDEGAAILDSMVESWADGDVEALARVVVDEMQVETPEVYEALLVKRNQNWAGQIQTLLEGSGTAFIAVGAGHLAGEDSVQTILESRGVAVEVAPN